MRKVLIVLTIITVLMLGTGIYPAFGITQATRDENNIYSNVGWFAVDVDEENYINGCTGTLISQTVFLTAAHCLAWNIDLGLDLYVSFDKKMGDTSNENQWIKASGFSVHPEFGHDQANLYDLAVILLPEGSTEGIAPATLTSAGLLDELLGPGEKHQPLFTSVGYGVQADWEKGPTQFFSDGWRNYAFAPLMALTPTQIYLNMNEHATGGGGACYGDSGGPIFLPMDNTQILVGVTSVRSDRVCRAMTTYYRLDTPWSREWLSQFVALP